MTGEAECPAAAAASTTITTTAGSPLEPTASQVAAVTFSIPSIRDLIFFYHAQIIERRLRLQITRDPVKRKELRRLARVEISSRPAAADFFGGPEYPELEDKWDETLCEDLWRLSPDEYLARVASPWLVRRKWLLEGKNGEEELEEQKRASVLRKESRNRSWWRGKSRRRGR